MKKIALTIMLITIVSKFLGFGREIALSYFYGASSISDAYLIAITVPSVIFSFISTGLAAGYIPMYSSIEEKFGELKSNRFTSNLINTLLVISTLVVLVSLVFTEQIVRLFASGFEGETLTIALELTQLSLFAVYFTGIVSILTGLLQVKGNYLVPALVGLPLNLFIIISIVLSKYIGTYILALGYVVAIFAQCVFMVPALVRNRFKYSFVLDFTDKNIIKLAYIIMPLILSVSVNQINKLVDRTLASQVAVGGISALNFANRLNGFVQGIFVISIVTALYPLISKMAAESNFDAMKKSISESITAINLLVIPATVGSMVFAKPIVVMLFGRGAFDASAIDMTASALFYYSLGMLGFGLRDILTRVFYSVQDTKTPMINGVIGVVFNIVLNFILSRYLGIGGLALATSISAIITTLLLFISLRKKIGPFGIKHISLSFIKILLASTIMGIVALLTYNYLQGLIGLSISLLLAIAFSGAVYFVIIFFMKIEDVDVIVDLVKNKIKTRRV